jgi:hypothetical protein
MGHYIVQSVSLRRSSFSKGDAFAWVRDHGYSASKVDISPHFYRFRQADPERFHGAHFRTIDLGEVGHLILAYF